MRARSLASQGVFGALEIICGGHRTVFASFWDRDRALGAIMAAWRDHQRQSGAAPAPEASATPPDDAGESAAPVHDDDDDDDDLATEEDVPVPASPRGPLLVTSLPPADGFTPLLLNAEDGSPALTLGCNAEELYTLCFADGSRFTEAFRAARGEWDVQVRGACTPVWYVDAYSRCA